MTVTPTGFSSVFAFKPSEDSASAGHPSLGQLGLWHRLLNEGEERDSTTD